MPKYEIMLIVDPIVEISEAEKIASDVFKTGLKKFEKMKNNELAYEIKKTKIANYVLMSVETSGDLMAEFTRKINIAKFIWRDIIINLDSEKGLNRKANPKIVRVPKRRIFGPKRPNDSRKLFNKPGISERRPKMTEKTADKAEDIN